MVVRNSRQNRHIVQDSKEEKLNAILEGQKQTNELLTLLVKACVRTVQVPASEQPPPNSIRVSESSGSLSGGEESTANWVNVVDTTGDGTGPTEGT